MSHLAAPMSVAHNHAANADEHLGNGLLIPAAEEHFKAAEAYMAAAERSNDESAKRTLRLLYNEHTKAGKDLQRRIEKLKEEGKDPSLPQKPDHPHTNSGARSNSTNNAMIREGIRAAPSPPPPRHMSDSQGMVDESFMLLAGQRSDPGDAFNQFWNIMQGMLDNLSQPVAFATIPLPGEEDDPTLVSPVQDPNTGNPSSKRDSSSDTDSLEEPQAQPKSTSIFSKRFGFPKVGRGKPTVASPSFSSVSPSKDVDFDLDDEGIFDEESLGDALSGSFFVVPSGHEASPAALRKENAALKAENETLKKRLEATERVLQMRKEQDLHLRDSIFQATREAQRVMSTSMLVPRTGGPAPDLNNLNINSPPIQIPTLPAGREAQYTRRIKELEEELRLAKVENEKNKAIIAKFRERWDKLKESAKRKKEAKAAAADAASPARERIVEEPEVEEELDRAESNALA